MPGARPHDRAGLLTVAVTGPGDALAFEVTLRAAPALEAAARDAAAPLAAALAARDAELAALVVDAWVISAVLIVT